VQNIDFKIKVNSAELLILVRGASLSVYPFIAEGFELPLETAAAKVPTICSNTTVMFDFDFKEALFDPLTKNDLKKK
jgi:glycosyltransferase involved in cell wall biosynthesis